MQRAKTHAIASQNIWKQASLAVCHQSGPYGSGKGSRKRNVSTPRVRDRRVLVRVYTLVSPFGSRDYALASYFMKTAALRGGAMPVQLGSCLDVLGCLLISDVCKT